jgi:hypothetical protein
MGIGSECHEPDHGAGLLEYMTLDIGAKEVANSFV